MNTCANPDEILKYIKTNKLTKEKFCEKLKIVFYITKIALKHFLFAKMFEEFLLK